MKIFRDTQRLPISTDEAWEFFSTPRNLEAMTPPWMRLKIVDLDSDEMREGQIIVYRIRLAPLIWTHWATEITCVEPGQKFVDDQRLGPYAFWHHTHEFAPADGGGVEMTDTIRYAVGWGPVGWLAHRIHIDRTVRKIFEFRRQRLTSLFGHEEVGTERELSESGGAL